MNTFTPFTTRNLFNELNNLFEESLSPVLKSHQLFSTETGWAIRIDLPGFDKSEIKLHFEDKALHLEAATSGESNDSRSPVSKRFALGEEVDTQSITANHENGVLEIALPRKEEAQDSTQQITIQ